jgi:hypothetical protein
MGRYPSRWGVLRCRVVYRARLPLRALILATAIVAAPLAGRVGAQGYLGLPLDPYPPVVLDCWTDVRLFDSLSAGTVDYCRAHLRYVPGALDCYQLLDRVCSVYLPGTGEWTELRQPATRLPFACPPGPEPPVCRRLGWQ